MPARDNNDQKHDELRACTPIELGAFTLANQKSARGTLSEDNKKLNCASVPDKFESEEALIAEQTKRQQSGRPSVNAFELTGKGHDEQYVRAAISNLETTMAVPGGRLEYLWFSDDNGNAEVFILGSGGKATPSDAPAPVPAHRDASKAEACLPDSQFVDKELNRQFLLPPNTLRRDASQIVAERETQSQCVLLGLSLNSTPDEIKAVQQQRQADVERYDPGPDATEAQKEDFELKSKAIFVGLSPFISSDQYQKTDIERGLSARAILLGLPQSASAEDIADAGKKYNDTVDNDWNVAHRLPIGTTYGQSNTIIAERGNQSDLVFEGIDIKATDKEVDRIRDLRNNQLNGPNSFDADGNRTSLPYQDLAIQIGVAADSSESVAQAQIQHARQSAAVKLGLDIEASQADIDAAQALANPKEVEGKVCSADEQRQKEKQEQQQQLEQEQEKKI